MRTLYMPPTPSPVEVPYHSGAGSIRWEDLVIPSDDHLIGHGAHGSVKVAIHRPTGTRYALKSIPASDAPERALRGDLLRLKLPSMESGSRHIVETRALFAGEGRVHLLLEFMAYGSLARILSVVGPLPDRAAAVVATHGTRALEVLHTHGMIHRDVTPSNLLIDCRGTVKLADFGLLVDPCGLAPNEFDIGTRSFLSPERMAGESCGGPGDVWGLGLCVASVAVGRFPLRDCETAFRLALHISERTAEVDFPDGVTADLRDFVAVCLTWDWWERPTATKLTGHPFVGPSSRGSDNPPDSILPFLPGVHPIVP